MVMDAIATALGAVKTTLDLVKGANDIAGRTDINLAVIDIHAALIETQRQALSDLQERAALMKRIEELEAAASKQEEWSSFADNYRLATSPLGAHYYEPIDLRPPNDVPHRLCTKCFSEKIASILHIRAKHSGGEMVHCPRCAQDLWLSSFTSEPINSPANSAWVV